MFRASRVFSLNLLYLLINSSSLIFSVNAIFVSSKYMSSN
jgi:hypothetical protein